jgi:outer membrane protein assembly factor BamB
MPFKTGTQIARTVLGAVLSRLTQPKLKTVLALSLFTAFARAESVYVLNGNGQFGTVNLGTGAFQPLGPAAPEPGTGLTPGPNGSLLTLDIAGHLNAINPTTGITSVLGPTGLADCSTPASSCGPTSANALAGLGGTLYATDYANNLYSVNPSTGRATLIGSTGMPAVPFVPFSENPDGTLNIFGEALFSANGTLYATFDTGALNPESGVVTPTMANHLYQIDPTTGTATLIGPTAFALDTVVGINGTFYAFKNDTSQIVTLNLANGSTTLVTDLDPSAGLVFGASPVPEPVSMTLAGLGIAALGIGRWLRRRAER